jgi:hypothetical protein
LAGLGAVFSLLATHFVKFGGSGISAWALPDAISGFVWPCEEIAAILSQWLKSSLVMEVSPTFATEFPGMEEPPQAARTIATTKKALSARKRRASFMGRVRIAALGRSPR